MATSATGAASGASDYPLRGPARSPWSTRSLLLEGSTEGGLERTCIGGRAPAAVVDEAQVDGLARRERVHDVGGLLGGHTALEDAGAFHGHRDLEHVRSRC